MSDMLAGEEYYGEFMRFASRYEHDLRFKIEGALNPGLDICENCGIERETACPSCLSLWVYPDGRIMRCSFMDTKNFTLEDYHEIRNHIQKEL